MSEQTQVVFGPDDVGCYADSWRGVGATRAIIADIVESLDHADTTLVESLRGPMPDDAWDEIEAFEVLDSVTDAACCYWGYNEYGHGFGLWFHGPDDDDIVISDGRGSNYLIGDASFAEIGHAIEAARETMESEQYFPNVWYVNERGNIDLLDVQTGEILASYV